MEKTIELEKRTLAYTLRLSKRAKSLRLSIACGGIFTVSAPLGMRQSVVDAFILEKSEWVLEKIRYFTQFPRKQVQGKQNRNKHFTEHKERARELVHQRLAHFNQFYKVAWRKVSIRNQRRRWGSCSQRGNLSFNYKTLFLSSHLADYIIVHELCHLGELNHSRKFWDLVSKVMPNHHNLRKELRQVGMSLA